MSGRGPFRRCIGWPNLRISHYCNVFASKHIAPVVSIC